MSEPETLWYRISVHYKNGTCVEFITDDCTVERIGGDISKVSWGAIRQDSKRPLHLGVDDISSVWSKEL